jgi:polyhydroxybutyrate depolymerase
MVRYLLFISLLGGSFLRGFAQQEGHITSAGLDRSFLIYVPAASIGGSSAASAAGPMPVLFVLHGRLGTPSGTLRLADFRPLADREGVILVYPAGIDKSWNDGRVGTPANKKGIDDVGFLSDLISYVISHYAADSNRIYFTGMSNGGFMTTRVACSLSNRIAAAAVVAASANSSASCTPALPVPMMYIQGTKDPLVPFDGGALRNGGQVDAHEQVLQRWARLDACNLQPTVTHLPDSVGDGTTISKEVFTNSTTGVKVVGYTIEGGGHTWPQGWPYLPKWIIGITSKNMNACEAIWAFCKEYRRG